VRLSGAFFIVSVPKPDDRQQVRRALEAWYREHAMTVLTNRVSVARTSTTWLRMVEQPRILVRKMRLRWGSVTSNSRIYFNVDLVKLPLGCVDYVVTHELAHLKVPNHGPAFWRLLSRCMPDWERWKSRLLRESI
jgi:hypothetical protein